MANQFSSAIGGAVFCTLRISSRCADPALVKIDEFSRVNKGHMAEDNDGDPVFLTRLQWDIDRVERDYPDLKLSSVKQMMI